MRKNIKKTIGLTLILFSLTIISLFICYWSLVSDTWEVLKTPMFNVLDIVGLVLFVLFLFLIFPEREVKKNI